MTADAETSAARAIAEKLAQWAQEERARQKEKVDALLGRESDEE